MVTVARPYFITPHAVQRWQERVDRAATAAAAIRDVQLALQAESAEVPARDGAVLRRVQWRGRWVIFVINPQGGGPAEPANGCRWPSVITIGGASHLRRWRRAMGEPLPPRPRSRPAILRAAPRRFTEAEETFIVDRLTSMTPAAIGRRLGRTEKSIRQWMWRRRQAPTRQDLLTSSQAAVQAQAARELAVTL